MQTNEYHLDSQLDELKNADQSYKLIEKLRFKSDEKRVDIAATNKSNVLNDFTLSTFNASLPDNINYSLGKISENQLSSSKIGIILLCGGLGSRGNGKIHPFRKISMSDGKQTTLLELQISRIVNSPLKNSTLCLFGSMYNIDKLKSFVKSFPSKNSIYCYSNGMQKRLTPIQKYSGPLDFYKTSNDNFVYNPEGHLGALRWLVASGEFIKLSELDVLIVTSYSNWGLVFTNDTLRLATLVSNFENDLMNPFVEVTLRNARKKSGSILVNREGKGKYYLVKSIYGESQPTFPSDDKILMSTHTWYFQINSFRRELVKAGIKHGIIKNQEELIFKMQNADKYRKQLLDIFNYSFPINPYISSKMINNNIETLQIESDLDQMSLLENVNIIPVLVPQSRAISIKEEADLLDVQKLKYIKGGQ